MQQCARLNVFQRLVRQWDTVHPYNAGQVLRVAGTPDLLAIRRAWHATLSTMRLGPARVVADDSFHFEPVNGDAAKCPVPLVPAGVSLDDYLSAEMNRPFENGHEIPLRPFVLQEDGSFYLGVIYQHWIADSASIRLVLHEWFTRVYDPAAATDQPANLAAAGYWKLFGPHRAKWRVGGQLLMLLRSWNRFRRVRKLRTQGSHDFAMRVARYQVPAGLLPQLVELARRHGVTVNDLFLAAIADVCDRFNPVRHVPRRRDLALGIIVDLRQRTRYDLSGVFGLFLGFANVMCRREDLMNWPRLVKHIARQTRAHKEADSPHASALWMVAALAAARFMPVQETFRFYRKHMPLAGGISNVNLNSTWAAEYHPAQIREYWRISPTGPMVPMVFNTTTLGGELTFTLTYRAALFTDEQAERIATTFLARLAQLAECGDALLREP